MASPSPPPPPPLGPRDYWSLDGRPVWLETGRVRARAGWFGRVILEIEEWTEIDDRPAGAAYSPGWWKRVTRWRRCRRGDFIVFDRPADKPAR
jgi:hypothetical protein